MSEKASEDVAPESDAAPRPTLAASQREAADAAGGVVSVGGAATPVAAAPAPVDMVISPQKTGGATDVNNTHDIMGAGTASSVQEVPGQPIAEPQAQSGVPAGNPQAQVQAQIGGLPSAAQQHPQNPYAWMQHPMFSHMLHPQFLQLTPQQQQMVLIQQQMMMQQMAQQSLQQQALQQSQAQAAAAASPSGQSTAAEQAAAQRILLQQQILQQSIQQQILQQSQYQAAIIAAASQHRAAAPQGQPLQEAQGSQQAVSAPQIAQGMGAPILLPGIPPEGIQAIYQADESQYQAQHADDSDDDEDGSGRSSRTLLRLVEDHHWVAALQRIVTNPRETQQVGIQGRTPLHVACDHDAPPALVQAILNAWPEGAERVGTSHMNPLHITCSSPHASVEVVRVLLAGCRDPLMITGAKDVDGDTPLHAACRCAAPMDVLVTLLQANPITVTWKDYEGLNPLMRLWVRYFVLVGEQIISNIKQPSDLNDDLVEAWQKSLLLLQVMSAMENQGSKRNEATPFRAVHAASSVDCPRCVVRIAMVLFPQELLNRDETNRLPIHIAAAAPVYAVHDLRGEGYTIDDVDFDDDPETRAEKAKKKECKYKEPSVIDILLGGEPTAASQRDPHGQLPLHVAIMRGKTLEEGVQALVEAHPDALTMPDTQTNLYPFMLAASVGRGRGDVGTIYALLRSAPELVHMALTGDAQDPSDLDQKPRAVEDEPKAPIAES